LVLIAKTLNTPLFSQENEIPNTDMETNMELLKGQASSAEVKRLARSNEEQSKIQLFRVNIMVMIMMICRKAEPSVQRVKSQFKENK
jgi:hypothetical protein